MRNFIGNVLITVGFAAFGKCMYELGRLNQKKHDTKVLKELCELAREYNEVLDRKHEKEES